MDTDSEPIVQPSAAASLPPELILAIIEHISGDHAERTASLCAARLVSRKSCALLRPLLFQKTRITLKDGSDGLRARGAAVLALCCLAVGCMTPFGGAFDAARTRLGAGGGDEESSGEAGRLVARPRVLVLGADLAAVLAAALIVAAAAACVTVVRVDRLVAMMVPGR